MADIIKELTKIADMSNSGILIFDRNDLVITANSTQRTLYPFIDVAQRVTYGDIAWACVNHRKLNEKSIYDDPEKWVQGASIFRQYNRFSKSLTHHSDGRVIEITYERLNGTDGWWYQMRRDVTASFTDHVRNGLDAMLPFGLADTAAPPLQSTFVVRLLDALPYPAALLTPRCQVIDGNQSFVSIVSRGDGIAVVSGRLCIPSEPDEQDLLSKRAAGFFRRRARTPVTLRVSRLDQPSPYFATLSEPPAQCIGWDSPTTGLLLLTIVDPDALPAVSPRTVSDLLQITGSEAEVALALCTGRSVEEIAEERGVERRTVYNQVSSILSKTGLRNQAAIVRQVTTLCWHFGSRA